MATMTAAILSDMRGAVASGTYASAGAAARALYAADAAASRSPANRLAWRGVFMLLAHMPQPAEGASRAVVVLGVDRLIAAALTLGVVLEGVRASVVEGESLSSALKVLLRSREDTVWLLACMVIPALLKTEAALMFGGADVRRSCGSERSGFGGRALGARHGACVRSHVAWVVVRGRFVVGVWGEGGV